MGGGGAAELADRLERFCARGIELRAAHSCAEPGITGRAHLRLGHDAGCSALGVPRRAIALTVAMWDQAGAGRLLLEAVDEAIAALVGIDWHAGIEPDDDTGGWHPQLARECLAYAIRIRITPRQARDPG